MYVIDQFINDLAHYELQKHVQFGHPKTLHEAISLATEFEALEGSIDRIKKPSLDFEKVAPILTSTSDNQQSPNITLEQISDLIDRKLNSLTTESRSRSRSPSHTRDQTSKSPNRITDSDIKRSSVRPNEKPSILINFVLTVKNGFIPLMNAINVSIMKDVKQNHRQMRAIKTLHML